jgi:hypothetical protein
MNVDARRAGFATRVIYCAGLLSSLPRVLAMSGGWVGLATGRSLGGSTLVTVIELLAAFAAFRIYQVARYPHALDAHASTKGVTAFRVLSLIAMVIGAVSAIGLFLVRPLTLLIFKTPGDAGIGYFVTAVFLVMGPSAGWMGCLAFEVSRRIGSAPGDVSRPPPFRWRQDIIVAVALVAALVGAPLLVRASAPAPCGQNRIACVANVKTDVRRMISLPLDTPVHLESTINAVRMQVRSGSRVRWEVIESPAYSLRIAGHATSDDSTFPVQIKIETSESGAGVLLHISVSDSGEETARFTASFPPGTRLERDSLGRLDILADLPSTSDSTISRSWPAGEEERETLDELFVFFRQAIGTELEAQESRLRRVGTAILASHADGVAGGRSIEQMRIPRSIDACGDRVRRIPGARVRSHAPADRGLELMLINFKLAHTAPPHTYAHGTEDIRCAGDVIWIVRSVPIESSISLRRYLADGTLQLFVESPLPYIATKGRYSFVDAASVREIGNAVLFDRIEVKRGKNRIADTVVGRDTFSIQFDP